MADSKKEDKMQQISELLIQGVHDLFTSEKYKTYLQTMSKFSEYSINNQILIAQQNPSATLVAGYKAWEEKFGRHIKKGEHGIRIIAPVAVKKKVKQVKKDEQGNVILNESGTPQTEEIIKNIPRFRTVTVFDVEQTVGTPLPERPGVKMLTAHIENYSAFMTAIKKVCPVPVRFDDDLPGTANGYYDPQAREIVIRSGMSESQTIKTAVHELVHARLHDPSRIGGRKDQVAREVEAESTAYMVCQHFQIDTSEYSFPYVAAWSSSVEMKELQQSMVLIKNEATDIINDLEVQMNMVQEKEVSFDQEPKNFSKQKDLPQNQQDWHNEIKQNIAIKRDIELAINKNFNHQSYHLNTTEAVKSVIAKYGAKSVNYVLASTIRMKDWDGRFSEENKKWAQDLTKAETFNEHGIDEHHAFLVDTHPTLLDAFVTSFRKYSVKNQDKNIENLAERLDSFAREYDRYQYMDTVADSEQHIQNLIQQLQQGDTAGIQAWLRDVMNVSDEQTAREAKALSRDLDTIRTPQKRRNIKDRLKQKQKDVEKQDRWPYDQGGREELSL